MQAPCAARLDAARTLLEFGVYGEGVQNLVALRRCAGDCGCTEWSGCHGEIDTAWQHRPTPLPEPRRRPGPR